MALEPGTIERKAQMLQEVAQGTPQPTGLLFLLVSAHLTVEAPELWGPIAGQIVSDFAAAVAQEHPAAMGLRQIVETIKDA